MLSRGVASPVGWAVFALPLLLSACGGGSEADPVVPDDPLAAYRAQTLSWQACDDSVAPAGTAAWVSRVQCAQVRVPRDYAHPADGDIEVGILRVTADHAGAQRKSLFFNPGGPGGDGLQIPFMVAGLWDASTDATETGRLQRELARTYDLIGFSPRGLGASTVLTCSSPEPLAPTDESITGRTAENISQQLRNTQRIAQACQDNPLTPSIHTEATVQDMDLIRGLLGDPQLNYVGWSYGTWLGAWYGARFPTRVGRMLLDSTADFQTTLPAAYLQQPAALTRAFNDVLAPYAARHPEAFGLGEDVDAIRGAFDKVHPALRQAVSSLLYSPLFASSAAPETFRLVRLANILSAPPFAVHWPTGIQGGNFPALQALLDTHVFSADPRENAVLGEMAREITLKVHANVLPRALHMSGDDAVYTAVVCNDTPPPSTDAQWWIDRQTEVYQNYPLVSTDDFRSCLYWQRPEGVTKPTLTAMADVPVLMVQAEYDGATPEAGARNTFAQLPRASLVYVPGEMSHGVYPYGDECVDLTVARFLLGTQPGTRELSCQAHPLARDAAKALSSARMAPQLGTASTDDDPQAAQVWADQIKRVIRDAAEPPQL